MWFCDDFAAGTTSNWDLLSVAGADGKFDIVQDGTNNVLQYTAATKGGLLALIKDSAWANVKTNDYYVEARIKPQTNATTANKQLYLIARYQDANNWYGAGLNVQNSTGSTQVEVARMGAGSIGRPVQGKRPILQDSQWYTVRFELIGTTLTVYLDGEKIGATTDASFTSGKIGLFTNNKSFQIDDIKVGDPAIKPVQLTLSPADAWTAELGDAARTVTVTATKNDGVTADTFSVESSNPAVVSTKVNGNTVTLTPVGVGSASIKFSSGSDSKTTRTIAATIQPAFVQSPTVYSLAGKVTPAAGETAAYIDTRLVLVFDAPPTLGTTGSIRIFKKSDDSLVDTIKLSGDVDVLGYTGIDQVRVVNDTPIKISGKAAFISPHNNKLAYNTEYYVAIADGVFPGTKVGGVAFNGLGKAAGWSFRTKAAAPTGSTVTVDDDGAADFRTVQGALNHVMQNVAKDSAATIKIKNGTYEELLFLRNKNNLTLQGESRDGVVIQYNNYESLNSGSGASATSSAGTAGGGRAIFLAEGSDLLTLDTLTFKSTHLRSNSLSNQAETIFFNTDTGRLIARNASFYSEQDTLQLLGYAWFYNTLVAGNVDFIWGANRVALFENSEIRTLGDTANPTSGGYVVQARTKTAADRGFVFLYSSLTYATGPGGSTVPTGQTYLARSAVSGTGWWDNVAFVNCKMDTHVIPAGWAYNTSGNATPNPASATGDTGWREFNSMDITGKSLDVTNRAKGSYQMKLVDYMTHYSSRAQIFANFNNGAGWNPQ